MIKKNNKIIKICIVVTPFRKSISTLLSDCSLRDGTINFIKHASKILLKVLSGALVSTKQKYITKLVFNISS